MSDFLKTAIRQACRRPEQSCVAGLQAAFATVVFDAGSVDRQAAAWVEAVRRQPRPAAGVAALLHEFSLSSQEGVALMCLAEALLRIPDQATADHLIRDKIGHGDWSAHLDRSPSLFVNAASWGLLLTGKLLAPHDTAGLGDALWRLLARGGEPLVRRGLLCAMRLLGEQFVLGEHMAAALARSQEQERRGYRHSFDMLGEAALTTADAERYTQAYAEAILAIGQASGRRGVKDGPGISVKLSALHPRYCRSQRERVMAELLPRLKGLMRLARQFDIGFNLDAEESDRLELSLDLLAELASDPELAAWDGMGFVVQAYQKRAPFVIDWLLALARKTRRRLMLRLVKGAYWDSEIKRAQLDGLDGYPVYTRKAHTDLSYLVCADRLLAAGDALYPQFATHNAQTLATLCAMARARGVDDYEFQCLHGMGEALYDQVLSGAERGRGCRIYAPVGSHETLLPYLVRRLLENGANTSFVNRLADQSLPLAQLLAAPWEQVRAAAGLPHPAIPLPADLYGSLRRNARGLDLADEANLESLSQALAVVQERHWLARPSVTGWREAGQARLTVRNPACRSQTIGDMIEAEPIVLEQALQLAAASAERWHRTTPAERAGYLLAAADLLESERLTLLGLCVCEAGKTWANAVAEVREAVDFCRYYAEQLLAGHFVPGAKAPGPAVCISPWNFPLAIFIGQVSAALAAGCPVLAKPAEQTPLIAWFAIDLLQRAGIPGDVVQYLPGRGEPVGARLVADARVKNVLFTGSLEVARLIQRTTAARSGVCLIAETGGLNAMIVDSSAQLEQVVQDVLTSAFDSAGQRCSALRVLCLQDEIAGRTLALLKAAMAELRVGDPAALATDIGPVIDAEAHGKLMAYIEQMRLGGRAVYQATLPDDCAEGCFVPPTVIEIEALSDLAGEVFGPVLHVVRFAGDRLNHLVEAINALGYGLTLGIQSRIDETVNSVVAQARVGNVYVNRNMVGAVVGVQPFGGEGLSGTGPKAGGPLYLHRLAGSEQAALSALPGRLLGVAGGLPSELRRLAEWAAASGRSALIGQCADYAALSLRNTCFVLPGPTGERNRLAFAPRGRMLCRATGESERLNQLAAVWATGNQAVLTSDDSTRQWSAGLPPDLAELIEWHTADRLSGLAGVLLEADDPAWRRRLADEPGPLIPVYLPGETSHAYPLYRMLAERVLSTNTAATGGNTTLIMLDA